MVVMGESVSATCGRLRHAVLLDLDVRVYRAGIRRAFQVRWTSRCRLACFICVCIVSRNALVRTRIRARRLRQIRRRSNNSDV